MPNLFRYPGGKSSFVISEPILEQLNSRAKTYETFCDVACGGASIALAFANQNLKHKIILNDCDPGIAALWKLVVNEPNNLISQIKRFNPTAKSFYHFQNDLRAKDCENRGFKQLAIHQISYSGLGRRAGSPIGGRTQKDIKGKPAKYLVDCRW